MARKQERYEPTTTSRFYPGRISDERKSALANFELSVDDFGADDVINGLFRRFSSTLYGLADVLRERIGEEAMHELLIEFGRRRGRAAWTAFLKARGAKRGNAELMAEFQDYGHYLGGPEFATAYPEIVDRNTCIVRRTTCGWHDPDAPESLCPYAGQGHVIGYHEADPALVDSGKTVCLAFGDDRCERVFRFNPRARKPTIPTPLDPPPRPGRS